MEGYLNILLIFHLISLYVPTVDENEIYNKKPNNDQRLEEDC